MALAKSSDNEIRFITMRMVGGKWRVLLQP